MTDPHVWRRRGHLWVPPEEVPLSPTVRAARSARGHLVIPTATGFSHGGGMQTNATASAAGTTITSGAANTKGSWATLIDPTSAPSYGVWVRVMDVAAATTITSYLLDIGYGPTGGGSEIVILPDLNCGGAPDHTTHVGGKEFFFPVYIPTGVALRARAQALAASDTALVQVWLMQRPMFPVTVGPVTAYGVDAANSRGTSVTPGNGAFGSWTLLQAGGLGPKRYWYCALDQLADNSQFDDRYYFVRLGVGPDASNVSIIFQGHCGEEGGECIDSVFPVMPQYGPVVNDAAADLWCQMAETGATEARGVIAYGMA